MVYIPRTNLCYIIGEKHNIGVVEYLQQYLVQELSDMANKAYEESEKQMPKITWKDSFFFGAIESIQARLEEQKLKFEHESNQTRALIVVKDEELTAAVRKFHPNVKRATPKWVYDNDGYAQGQEAGSRVLLQRAIEE